MKRKRSIYFIEAQMYFVEGKKRNKQTGLVEEIKTHPRLFKTSFIGEPEEELRDVILRNKSKLLRIAKEFLTDAKYKKALENNGMRIKNFKYLKKLGETNYEI